MEWRLLSLVEEVGMCVCCIPPPEQESNPISHRISFKIAFYSTCSSSGPTAMHLLYHSCVTKPTSEWAAPLIFPCSTHWCANPASLTWDTLKRCHQSARRSTEYPLSTPFSALAWQDSCLRKGKPLPAIIPASQWHEIKVVWRECQSFNFTLMQWQSGKQLLLLEIP